MGMASCIRRAMRKAIRCRGGDPMWLWRSVRRGLLDCAREQNSLGGSYCAELLDRAREEAVSGGLPLSGAA